MKLKRRQTLLIVWFLAIILSAYFVAKASGSLEYGIATAFGLLAISLGVPLMRAFTEFSE